MRSDIDLIYFKKRLEDRLQEIRSKQEKKKGNKGAVELDQARIGRLSRMDAMQQQAMEKATARLVDQERQRIQAVLARMGEGEYGYCILCEEEIAEGRLEFDPSVLVCIDCAKEKEQEAKR